MGLWLLLEYLNHHNIEQCVECRKQLGAPNLIHYHKKVKVKIKNKKFICTKIKIKIEYLK
jgi:hypothetical protein